MQKKPSAPTDHVLNPFIEKHQKDVIGILHSFDRLRLQGSLRYLYCVEIFEEYLSKARVLFKDFKKFATELTAAVCQNAEQLARSLGRPFLYLNSTCLSKEDEARRIIGQDGIKEGLVAVFRCVEPCRTYKAQGNHLTKMLEVNLQWGKCLHLYFYVQHPRLGLLHLRLQTWFPLLIHICLNGHEWLARQLDAKGVAYRKADNRFTWIEDLAVAQSLADAQLRTDWVALCDGLRQSYHRLHDKIAQPPGGLSYYWTAPQTEFASDILFREQRTLERLFPRLTLHALLNLGCEQVMRFMGKQLNGNFGGEVVTDLRRRSEGMRIKHWVNENSIKLYNCLNVLRPETTIHNAEDLKVYRTPETRPDAPMQWYPLPRGVADLYRRAQISRLAIERYLSALAAASVTTPLAEEAIAVCQHVRRDGRRYRALNPFEAADAQLLAAVNRGEWALKGFRNREIRTLLFGQPKDKKQQRSQAAKVTRRLALLHAHVGRELAEARPFAFGIFFVRDEGLRRGGQVKRGPLGELLVELLGDGFVSRSFLQILQESGGVLASEPFAVRSFSPFGEIDFVNRTAVEVGLEDCFYLGQAIEPGENGFCRFIVLESKIELVANGGWETGDFAVTHRMTMGIGMFVELECWNSGMMGYERDA